MRQAGVAGIYRRRNHGCTRRDLARDTKRRSRRPPVRPDRAGPPVGHGRHRTPHRRRQGVPRRGPRRVQSPGRGLVDRRSHPLRARRRRRADGHLAAPATRRPRPSPIPTTAPNTRPGRSGAGSAPPACSARWASIGDCFDNSVAESFFGTLQLELLDEHRWATRQQLALADLRLDRSLVQPAPPALLLRHAQPHRLRDRQRGMIPTTTRPPERGKLTTAFWAGGPAGDRDTRFGQR